MITKVSPGKGAVFYKKNDTILKGDYHMSDITPEQILKVMQDAGKPVRPGDVAKALNVESKELTKVFDVLKKDGRILSPKRCYYAPAE